MDKEMIVFQDVSKSYKIYKNKPSTLKEKVINSILRRNRTEIIKKNVLNQASFTIYSNETVAIIGRNGAGKSTTLKLIARILTPDEGRIEVKGSVASLLEIGAGFQQDLTGKENVYLYGSILGLSKKYILNNYNKIVDFAELGDYMETAVKNYSSGMYMRLAFSVAIHVDPDILIIDEVLAVGDANFQSKCINKLRDFQKRGKTIVFVSHDISTVKELSDRVIYIEEDGIASIGEKDRLINLYYAKLYGTISHANSSVERPNDKLTSDIYNFDKFKQQLNEVAVEDPSSIWGNQRIVINEVYFSNIDGIANHIFHVREDIILNIELESFSVEKEVVLGLAIYDHNHHHLSGPNSKKDGVLITEISGKKTLKVAIRNQPFLQGTYYITLAVYDYSCTDPYYVMDKYFKFHVLNERQEYGAIGLDCDWLF